MKRLLKILPIFVLFLFVSTAKGNQLIQLTTNPNGDIQPDWVGSKIVYRTFHDSQQDLGLMDADGSNKTLLTNDLFEEGEPAISPDGKKIAFSWNKGTGSSSIHNIWIMNIDGSGLIRITDTSIGYGDRHPTWSPDGRYIVYTSWASGSPQIWKIDLQTGEKVQLTNSSLCNFQPDWCPNGKIVFTRGKKAFGPNCPDNPPADIWIMDADGSNQIRLTYSDAMDIAADCGKNHIVFVSDRSGNLDIWMMDLKNGELTQLTTHPAVDTTPSWNKPYYTSIVFRSDRSGNADIWKLIIDEEPPTLTILSPTNTTYSLKNIALEVVADEPIDTWWYNLNSGPNLTFTPNTTLTVKEGLNKLVVYANDTFGNIGFATVYFTVETEPTIIIFSPFNNSIISKLPINLSLNLTDGIRKVEIFTNKSCEAKVVMNESVFRLVEPLSITKSFLIPACWPSTQCIWKWTQFFPNGLHCFSIYVHDEFGNVIESKLFFTLNLTDNTPPKVIITNPQEGIKVRGEIFVNVNVTDIGGVVEVRFYINGKFVKAKSFKPYPYYADKPEPKVYPLSKSVSFFWNTTNWPNGKYEILIKAWDKSGNIGYSKITLIVHNLETFAEEKEPQLPPEPPLPNITKVNLTKPLVKPKVIGKNKLQKVKRKLPELRAKFDRLVKKAQSIANYYLSINKTSKYICWYELTLMLEASALKVGIIEMEIDNLLAKNKLIAQNTEKIRIMIKKLRNYVDLLIDKVFECGR